VLKLLLLSNKGFTAHKTNYINKEFLEQWKKNAWSENEDRDDFAFWEPQKKECLEVNPTHALAIAEMDQDFEEASM
jgi:hypothetical protein